MYFLLQKVSKKFQILEEYNELYKNFSKSWSAFDVALICTRGRQSSLQIKKWNKHPLGMGGLGYTGVIDPINTR